MTKITPHRFDASGTAQKRCSKCKNWGPLGNFFKDKAKWDGLKPVCKECLKKYSKVYNNKNAKKIAAQRAHKWRNDSEYREANKRCNRVKYQTDSAYREKWKKYAYERSQIPEVKKRKHITNKKRIEKMYVGVSLNRNFMTKYIYPVFLIRRFLFVLIPITFPDHPFF